MFKILKGGNVLVPDSIGIKDILIAGQVIANIKDSISPSQDYGEVEVIDVSNRYVVPGFIDQHVHLIGSGGERGYASRTPEMVLSDIIRWGVTTVVGCLGTDGATRQISSLLAKARALEEEGVTTFIYTGSYEIPTTTITGSVRSDILLIDKVIGCGEMAISDHRSAQPTKEDIKKLAAEARVGGMLSGKAGLLHVHVGSGRAGLKVLFERLEESELPASQFTPTHINRNQYLLEDGIRFTKMGGTIDITSNISPQLGGKNSIKSSKAIKYCLDSGASIDLITMSSDGNTSMPITNDRGQVIGLTACKQDSLYYEFKDMVLVEGISITDALKVLTLNQAKVLMLYPKKGCLQVGSDADILVLDRDLNIEHVFAKGRHVVREGRVLVKGTYEQ